MEFVSYTELRNSMKSIMDKACYDHDPVAITRKSGKHMVLISLEDYRSMEETNYLLSSPRNAERLRASLEELRQGKGIPFELEE